MTLLRCGVLPRSPPRWSLKKFKGVLAPGWIRKQCYTFAAYCGCRSLLYTSGLFIKCPMVLVCQCQGTRSGFLRVSIHSFRALSFGFFSRALLFLFSLPVCLA